MAQPTNQQLRELFVEISDRAIIRSLESCSDDGGCQATGGRDMSAIIQDLNTMLQDMKAVRERLGGTICGTPRDNSSVDSPRDGSENMMLANREDQTSTVDEPMTAPCELAESPGTVTDPAPVRAPLTLMGLPSEIRSMVWWATLAPEGKFVSIVPYKLHTRRVGEPKCNPWYHSERPVIAMAPFLGYTYEREGERGKNDAFWALRQVNRKVCEEAANEYWRRVILEGLMLSFTCHRVTANYFGIGIASAFLFGYHEEYLRNIRRLHLDLRRLWRDDPWYKRQAVLLDPHHSNLHVTNFAELLDPLLDLMSTRLTGLCHLSLTFSNWVPDVRQTPWMEAPPGVSMNDPYIESSEHWVRRMKNIRGLTRLRLRVVVPSENADEIPVLAQDPGVLRTIQFLSMLRGSMLVNGDALGVGNMRLWFNVRKNVVGENLPTWIVVQCDDSWDEDAKKHAHHVEDDDFDPLDGVMLEVDTLNGLNLGEEHMQDSE